ncbi:Uncharacterised protein [Vibrio cholerae]|uniref:Uncharacterized protein n=1 Tax=Vibrio cholerae TaxID=666 RepID=A0A655SKH0_VIBCL|nr:Uncharacterised protein [Vibrio cholerae]
MKCLAAILTIISSDSVSDCLQIFSEANCGSPLSHSLSNVFLNIAG